MTLPLDSCQSWAYFCEEQGQKSKLDHLGRKTEIMEPMTAQWLPYMGVPASENSLLLAHLWSEQALLPADITFLISEIPWFHLKMPGDPSTTAS